VTPAEDAPRRGPVATVDAVPVTTVELDAFQAGALGVPPGALLFGPDGHLFHLVS